MSLFRKVVASATLAALVISTGATGVSAYSTQDVTAANGLAAAGVVNDHSADPSQYELERSVLRQETAKIAVNLDENLSVKATCENEFADITATTPNTWVCGYAEALRDAGKVSANAKFNPERNVTKSEAVKMMLDAAGCSDFYSDAAKWQEQTVAFASENGIAPSFTDYNTPATRGFVFSVAYNAMNTCPVEEEVVCDETLAALGICELEENTAEETNNEETTNEETTTVASNEGASVKLSAESPVDGDVATDSPRTPLIAFDVTAGDEDLTLDEISLKYTGLSETYSIENLSVYLDNDKVSKGTNKKFDSENERDLSFEKDTVVKAGETKTFFVTAYITGGVVNERHQVTITNVKTKAGDLEGTPLVGPKLNPVVVYNKGLLKLTDETASDDITIGEEAVLAGFNLEETSKKEDVLLKSITFKVEGSIDAEDDLADIKLLADGKVIADNLSVNNDDEIIADLDLIIPADKDIEFEVRGTVTSGVDKQIQLTFETPTEDIYAIGVDTKVSIKVTDSGHDISDLLDIEGAEINVSFDKSDIDEAKPDAEEVLVGTLNISAETEDYTVKKLAVEVKNTSNNGFDIEDIIKDLELDGSTYDSVDNIATDTATFYFEDFDIDSDLSLPITFDVVDDTLINDTDLEFNIYFDEVEDNEEDKTYAKNPAAGELDIDDILSSNTFNKKTVTIETATFTITSTEVNERDLVLGNGVETVVYKAKINVGDADSVKLKDFELLDNGSSLSNNADFEDIIANATLNIGGTTFDGDVYANKIKFKNINAVIEAGASNVEVLATVELKDSDKITGINNILQMKADLDTANDLEDSDGEELINNNIDTTNMNTHIAVTNLLDRGTFVINILNDPDTDDNLENTVLAGNSNITLAELELEANYEDAKIKEIAFDFGYGEIDFSNTLENVKLVNADNGSTIVDGGIVTFDSINKTTVVTFKNDFVIADADNLINAELVADLNRITGTGDETSAKAGQLRLEKITADKEDIKGVQSNDELIRDANGDPKDLVVDPVNDNDPNTEAGEIVTIVPAKLQFVVKEYLNSGQAKIEVVVDAGDNTVGDSEKTPNVIIDTINLETSNYDLYDVYRENHFSSKVQGAAEASFNQLSKDDRTIDLDNKSTGSERYIFAPINDTATSQTYTLVLPTDIAKYKILDENGVALKDANGNDMLFDATLSNEINAGSYTISK